MECIASEHSKQQKFKNGRGLNGHPLQQVHGFFRHTSFLRKCSKKHDRNILTKSVRKSMRKSVPKSVRKSMRKSRSPCGKPCRAERRLGWEGEGGKVGFCRFLYAHDPQHNPSFAPHSPPIMAYAAMGNIVFYCGSCRSHAFDLCVVCVSDARSMCASV